MDDWLVLELKDNKNKTNQYITKQITLSLEIFINYVVFTVYKCAFV